MSLKLSPIAVMPEDTARIAQAAFPKGTPYLVLRDEVGAIFTDEDFADLFSQRGQRALAPWQRHYQREAPSAEGESRQIRFKANKELPPLATCWSLRRSSAVPTSPASIRPLAMRPFSARRSCSSGSWRPVCRCS